MQVLRNIHWRMGVVRWVNKLTALPLPHQRLPLTNEQVYENRCFLEGYRWAMAHPDEAKFVRIKE